MQTCIVTGAGGLIGSHLVSSLCDEFSLWGLSRGPLAPKALEGHVKHLPIDLAGSWRAEDLPKQVDAVIHLAQSEHFRDFPDQAENVFGVNTASTVRLLDYARRAGAKTFVLASSGGIYGYGDRQFSEDVEVVSRGDLGFYLGTKLCSEILSESYTPYMNVIVLRFFFVYGPGQKSGMLIPRLVQSVLSGVPISLAGEHGIRMNPTYVSDAVAAIRKTLSLSGSHKINVGGPEALSLREIGQIIGQTVGREPKFDVQPNAEPRHLVGDVTKMSKLLHRPEIGFAEGVARYVKAEALVGSP